MASTTLPEYRPGQHHGHVSGTVLDAEPHAAQADLPGRLVSFGAWLGLTIIYAWIGYRFTVNSHVVVFDALDRMTRALLVWHNDPPKLAAVGFVFPPLTTMFLLPFAVIKPVATSLVAVPMSSAVFAAGAVVMLDRTCARCDMKPLLRLPLVGLFAINPFWVFYAGNGMSEAAYAFLLSFLLYSFISWYATTEPRFLIAAGFGLSVLVLTRYAFIIWGLLFALLIGVALIRRRASKVEVEGSVIAFGAPIAYVLALWILFNWLIVGDPLGWISDATTSTQAVNSSGIDDQGALAFSEIAQRMLQLNSAIFPLAFAVVPALVVVFVTQRNDMALWLASFIVLGIVVIGIHAYTAEKEGLLTLRDSMPMYVASFVGAAWLFRSMPQSRLIIFGVTVGLLIVNLFTAWAGMKRYPFQGLEQAFTRAVFSGDDQEGTQSRGGFTVGIANEAKAADYIKANIPKTEKNAILVDNAQAFGVILLSGRPQIFYDRIDKGDGKFRQVLDQPFGVVQYMLVTSNSRSDDLIARRYPQAAQGKQPGMRVVFSDRRYTLLRLANTAPATTGGTAAGRKGASSGTGQRNGTAQTIAPKGATGGSGSAVTTPTSTTPGGASTTTTPAATQTPSDTGAAGVGSTTTPTQTTP